MSKSFSIKGKNRDHLFSCACLEPGTAPDTQQRLYILGKATSPILRGWLSSPELLRFSCFQPKFTGTPPRHNTRRRNIRSPLRQCAS